MADDVEPFREPAPGASLDGVSPPPARYPTPRFYDPVTAIIVWPFVLVFGYIDLIALTHGGLSFGIVLGAILAVFACSAIVTPYEAVVKPDGSLIFRSRVRTVMTTVDDVYRIGPTRGGWAFYFDERVAKLGGLAGSPLARWLVQQNPAIDAPRSRYLRRK